MKGHELRIAPLRNLPVIKDLVTDMDPFFDKWVTLRRGITPPLIVIVILLPLPLMIHTDWKPSSGIECINCAVCYAACDTVAGNPDYLGLAALQRAWTLFNDARDEDGDAILDAVSGTGGCHNCHSMGSCAHYCPNELNPMTAIAGLKRATARRFVTGSGKRKPS